LVKDNLSVRKRLWEVVVDVRQVWKVDGDPVPTYLTPKDLAYDAICRFRSSQIALISSGSVIQQLDSSSLEMLRRRNNWSYTCWLVGRRFGAHQSMHRYIFLGRQGIIRRS
jgi:hypothetical protein